MKSYRYVDLISAAPVEPGHRQLAGAAEGYDCVANGLGERVGVLSGVELIQNALVFVEIACLDAGRFVARQAGGKFPNFCL